MNPGYHVVTANGASNLDISAKSSTSSDTAGKGVGNYIGGAVQASGAAATADADISVDLANNGGTVVENVHSTSEAGTFGIEGGATGTPGYVVGGGTSSANSDSDATTFGYTSN